MAFGSELRRIAGLTAWLLAVPAGSGFALEHSITQLVVSIAPGWNSSSGTLGLFERNGKGWRAVSPPMSVLYGKNGLAWGRGVLGAGEPGLQKVERDKRAPAGIFAIGKIYTYDQSLPVGSDYPFHTMTTADAWIDDPLLPNYNQHVVVDPVNPPPWFEKQKMRLNDPPHRWLVEIRHNADPPVPAAGSAIFFHLQRGRLVPSAGCTVMSLPSLTRLITWLRAAKNPHYVLLTREEYLKRWQTSGLPSPTEAAGLLLPGA